MAQAFEFLLNIQGPERSWVYRIPIQEEPVYVGRIPGVEIQLAHQQVSRRHAALRCTDTECVLVDMGSANGTILNGKKLAPQIPVTLKTGDSLQIGPFKLDFEQKVVGTPDAPEASSEPIIPPGEIEKLPVEAKIERLASPPPPPPVDAPPPILPSAALPSFDPSKPPPGLRFEGERLLSYLPSIYHTDFMKYFMGIFEAILFPIEWQIDNFDLFLDPGTAPNSFLPWLANWFDQVFDASWTDAQRRAFLKEAYAIYSRSGTRWALSRILQIYCGQAPEIDDESADLPPYTFRVKIPQTGAVEQKQIERLIDAHKPTHTAYILEIAK
jgi:phage tail-like protein